MNAKMEMIETKDMPPQVSGPQMQLVQALSSLGDMPELAMRTDVSKVLQEIKKAQARLTTTSSALSARRNEHANKSWYAIFNDTETLVRDAQLDMNAAMTELGSQSTKLLLFNTAISKVICDMQGLLLAQQGKLDEQTAAIARQSQALLDNDLELKELYTRRDNEAKTLDKFVAQVTQVMMALDASQEDAHQRLVAAIARSDALSNRLDSADRRTDEVAAALAKVAGETRSSQEQLAQRLDEGNARVEAFAVRLDGADCRADEAATSLAKVDGEVRASQELLAQRLDHGDALLGRQSSELRQEFEARIAGMAKVVADRERLVVEQVRQETARSYEAIASQLALLQAKGRAQGRLVRGLALGVAISIAVAVVALASHFVHA